MKRQQYDSAPLPISWTPEQYGGEKRLVAYVIPNTTDTIPMRTGLDFIASDDPRFKTVPRIAQPIDYLPAEYLSIPYDVDKLVQNGTLQQGDTTFIHKPEMIFDFSKKQYLGRHELIILDMMETNRFERPMYYAITVGEDQRIGMSKNFRQTGMAYQILPIEVRGTGTEVDLERMYRNVTEKYRWGGADKPGTYFDENSRKQVETYRSMIFAPLARGLALKGDLERAKQVLRLSEQAILEENMPHSVTSLPLVEAYYLTGLKEEADRIASMVIESKLKELDWFLRLKPELLINSLPAIQDGVLVLTETMRLCESQDSKLKEQYGERIAQYQQAFLQIYKTIQG